MESRDKRVLLPTPLCIHIQNIALRQLRLSLSPGKFMYLLLSQLLYINFGQVHFMKSLLTFSHPGPADMAATNSSSTAGCVCRYQILLPHQNIGESWHCNMDGKEFIYKPVDLLHHCKYRDDWEGLLLDVSNAFVSLHSMTECAISPFCSPLGRVCSSSAICARGFHGTAAPGLWPTAWRRPSPVWLFFTSPSLGPKHTAGCD